MGFSVSVSAYGLSYGGSGSGAYQFPVLISDNGLESSTVNARLDQSEVLSVDFSLPGIPDSWLDPLEPWVEELATLVVQESYGSVALFDLSAWKLGNGDIRLLGRGPLIYPEYGTVAIGMNSNLVRPLEGIIEVDPVLPEGIDLGMQFHPELVLVILERMLHEGFIPRSYDGTGAADESGGLSVSMKGLAGDDQGLLHTQFRLWQLGGEACGYTDLDLGLGLSISDQQVKLTASSIDVTGSDGVGDALAAIEGWLDAALSQEVASYSGLAINYRELSLPMNKQASMSSDSFRLEVGAAGLSVYLRLDGVVDRTQ
jgi:hypothetical protein